MESRVAREAQGGVRAREELLKAGITDDPNDPENRRRYFKMMFPHLVKANHVNGRYGDGDHPSLASKRAQAA